MTYQKHTNYKEIKEEAERYICGLYRISRETLHSPSRRRLSVRARFDIWFYLRYKYGVPFEKIALMYDRHHTTVIHGVVTVMSNLYPQNVGTMSE